MPKRETETERMVREVHTAIVGTPDGKVKGLRSTVEAIEDRHKALDEGRRTRQVVGAIKHGATMVAGAVAGYLSGHKQLSSRLLTDLEAVTRRKVAALLGDAKRSGIELLVTSTYRSFAEQDALYAQKPKVTNAKGGQSFHNVRRAVDVVPLIGGKAVWDHLDLWPKIGQLGRNHALSWGGDWVKFSDLPHFQWDFCEKHSVVHHTATSFREDGSCGVA